MKIVCVGGGPAGLYFAILSRLRAPDAEVTVIERNPLGATHGWGVTWGEDFLDDLYGTDPVSARRMEQAAMVWANQEVGIGDHPPVHIGGMYGYATGRSRMGEILVDRARELGVELRFGTTVEDDRDLDADLVVAADGVGSRLRAAHADVLRPTITAGTNRYLWLGTSKVFSAFAFTFRPTDAGWLWAYAYPTSGSTSTFIVECATTTWERLGLGALDPDACLAYLEDTFAGMLEGHRLLEPPAALSRPGWNQFREIRNDTWRDGRLVLAGDAAHTTHFGIGSGTVLAVEDAITLARHVHAPGAELDGALSAYDRERRAQVGPVQDMAMRNMRWFETADARLSGDPVRVAYSLFDRRGNQAPWRYQLHLATQIEPLRQVRTRITAARRSARARHRSRALPVEAGLR